MNNEEKTKSLNEYYDKFIKPHITEEFIQKAMLIPYLPEKTIKELEDYIFQLEMEANT